MALSISHANTTSKIVPSKIVVGIVAAAMTAFVGLAGVAGATSNKPMGNNHGYGNGNINVNLNVNGNNNHISIIIRYIFGG